MQGNVSLSKWQTIFCIANLAMLLPGVYYAYDIPASLYAVLQNELGSNDEEYEYQMQLMYALYSFPNIILPVGVGAVMDRLGTPKSITVVFFFVILGQILTSLGVANKSFYIILTGRTIFGIGGESVNIVQGNLSSYFFNGSFLSFVLAFNTSVARAGSVANDLLTRRIQMAYGSAFAFWVGTLICAVASALWLARFYSKMSRNQLLQIPTNSQAHVEYQNESQVNLTEQVEARMKHSSSNSSTENIDEKGMQTVILPVFDDTRMDMSIRQKAFQNIKYVYQNFPLPFWLICADLLIFNGIMIPFNLIQSSFVGDKFFGGDDVTAKGLMSIPNTACVFLGPLIGIIQDKKGNLPFYLIACGGLYFISHSLLTFSNMPPIIAISLLSFPYVFQLTVWPCIPKLLQEKDVSLGFGIATAIMNLGLFLVPIIVAWVGTSASDLKNGQMKSFYNQEYLFLSMAFLSIIISIILFDVDKRRFASILSNVKIEDKDTVELHSSISKES
ncbi:Major facilitator superfamily, general substrate transporter domain-containing protein [Rozella allomycis CSF55]|uniref:Lysosomal dipeptide transporter MFSD1 n=1 Tax=Rozella allomycis (strain CSF55) TaxID=988480 RepID=A0A075AR71_ROZAC|nr:Major facilitator superfamily, general substrate transporter domain-containing protein [Rozella allomycis CSF55]|eukprot:EPZ32650.1 Major facilitator superfamily, general substrate transporter domain-containing protein [Rozella allomycis CSF55]